MDVSPDGYIASRVYFMFAVSAVQKIFDTKESGFIRYINILCASSFHIICGMDTREGRFDADVIFIIIVSIFHRFPAK